MFAIHICTKLRKPFQCAASLTVYKTIPKFRKKKASNFNNHREIFAYEEQRKKYADGN